MPEVKQWLEEKPELYRRSKVDGLVERLLKAHATGREGWVPVVPEGQAAGHVSWLLLKPQLRHLGLPTLPDVARDLWPEEAAPRGTP